MKKTFVTLATVAALVAAAAPAATTLANGTFIPQEQGAQATVALVGREYAEVVAKANVAYAKLTKAANDTFVAEQNRDFLATLVTTYENDLANAEADLAKAWQNAGRAGDADDVDPAVKTPEVLAAEAAVETAKAAVATAKRQVAEAEEIVAGYKATQAAYQAELDELVAKKNELYNKFIAAGATPEQVAQAEAGAEVTAPSNTAGKPAAKPVAAAKTGTGSKTLPKTSAAK
ncbi:hypothetical protein HO625_04960 [Streptococcus suis]|nr:hypothetical protein [Streptococcus suis]